MDKKIINIDGRNIAFLLSDDIIIKDAQTALDLIAELQYHDDCTRIAIHKSAVCEEFFNLRTGVAGEVLQKFVNYSAKLAIIGVFSMYESKALRDFITESNRGSDIFFVGDEETAADKLSRAV